MSELGVIDQEITLEQSKAKYPQKPLRGINQKEAGERDHWGTYFEANKQGLRGTLSAAMKTEYGQEILVPFSKDVDSLALDSFLTMPQIIPENLAGNPQRFLYSDSEQDDSYTVHTTGSSGVRKEIKYRPQDLVAPLDAVLVNLFKASKHPILLKDADTVGTSYDVIKKSVDTLTGKEINVVDFTMPDEAVDAIINSNSDTVYLTISPTLARLLLSGWEDMYKNKDPRLQSLKGRTFLLELAGERVSIDDLQKWNQLLDNMFGKMENSDLYRIVSIYGQSEHLMVGKYLYNPEDKAVKYKVRDGRFCLVLDENGKPIIGKEGKIEVTSTTAANQDFSGKTILPRYVTGDVATAEFDENGQLYLKEVRRDPERELISILGDKIFLGDIPRQLDEAGFPTAQIEYQVLGDFPFQVLSINLCSKDFVGKDGEMRAKAIQAMKKIITTNYSEIEPPIKNGVLKVTVGITNDVIEKRWKLLPRKPISKEEYGQISSNIVAEDFIKEQ